MTEGLVNRKKVMDALYEALKALRDGTLPDNCVAVGTLTPPHSTVFLAVEKVADATMVPKHELDRIAMRLTRLEKINRAEAFERMGVYCDQHRRWEQ